MSEAATLVLVTLLAEPLRAQFLSDRDWAAVLTAARAETLLGTLAARLSGLGLPMVERVLSDARHFYQHGCTQALWEAECAARALADYDGKVILLKGTAYLAAGLDAGRGRSVGDLDILVDRRGLDDVQQALLDAGWEWVNPDPYDDEYYRRWMHELPPLIHRARDRMIDVHHTVLPLTARPTPDAAAMIDAALLLENGLYVLAPADMVCHCAAHLIADGDLAGGLRNLWDFDRLVREFSAEEGFFEELIVRAQIHGLSAAVGRALRLARRVYGTPVETMLERTWRPSDRLFEARLMARDGWGRETRKGLRFAFYIRSHLLRMPLAMLVRHLWTKWCKRRVPGVA